MQDFNLEQALAGWRKRATNAQTFEDGELEELQSGLLDRYDELLIKGYDSARAFEMASERTLDLPLNGGKRNTTGSWFSTSLLGSYFKVARRNLRARRWYNLTNYIMLTLGTVTAAIALLYLNYETSYDGHLKEVEQKYRVGMDLRAQGYSMISFPDFNGTAAADQRRQIEGFADVTGVAQAVQFITFPEIKLAECNALELPLENLLETNTPDEFLDYFGLKLLAGDPTTLGAAPDRVILTQSVAQRYFGKDWATEALKEPTLRIDTNAYVVAGVVADPPPNSHFTYSVIVHRAKLDYWGCRTYLKLDQGTEPRALKENIDANFGSINARLASDELFGGVILQPVRSIHLGSDLLYELKPPGDVRYLYIIGLIALIILLLTVSNYTNLSVVMNAGRTREVGMRKVFGADNRQIAGQFLLEAVLLSLFTLPLVALMLWWLMPRFNLLMDVDIPASIFSTPKLPLLLTELALFVGLLAGIYPAVFLTRTKIRSLFGGRVLQDSGGKFTTRKVIITLQFVLLIGLCSLTFFVNRQLSYIQSKDLGYKREGIVYVQTNADSSRFVTFQNELLRLPNVQSVGSGTPMGQMPYNQTTYQLSGTDQVYDDANNIYLDYTAIQQLGIETTIPDYVANPDQAPRQLVLINSTMAERLKNRFQLTEAELIGQTLIQEPEFTNEETGEVGFPYLISGIFSDLHLFSLRESIDPMFMTVYRNPRYVYTASVAYQDADPQELLARLERVYEEVGLARPFKAEFLTKNLSELYRDEARISTLSNYFSLLALLLATVGLVALTAYLTTLKRKEIGIRKILGASHFDILKRFNLEYLPLLIIATLLAIPLSWWGIARWLEGFAYRIQIDLWVFVLAVLLVAVITVVAVSAVTLRAARSVPARVLTRND